MTEKTTAPPAAPAGAPNGLHPNHLADLRYVLKTLEKVLPTTAYGRVGTKDKDQAELRGDVQAAINGMNYIIARTEEGATAKKPATLPAVDAPSPAASGGAQDSPSKFKVRDRVIHIHDKRTAIVTALTPRGFRYFLDERHHLGPRHGYTDEGEALTDDGWELVVAASGVDAVLREALDELHEAHKAQYPRYEDGKASQDAWAARIEAAHEEAVRLLSAAPSSRGVETFQQRVRPWMMACFGPAISADVIERNHRFLEESLELIQSTGCTKSEAHQLVDYVYGRPAGDTAQEVGGVMVTLAALCLAHPGLDMHRCGEVELARIWTMVEKIRAKQAAKPKHSPLPERPATPVGGNQQ